MSIFLMSHVKSLTDLIELMSFSGWIAVVADVVWVFRDISVGGLTFGIGCVAVGLCIALVLLSVSLYQYHVKNTRELIHKELKDKLKIAKSKYKAIH